MGEDMFYDQCNNCFFLLAIHPVGSVLGETYVEKGFGLIKVGHSGSFLRWWYHWSPEICGHFWFHGWHHCLYGPGRSIVKSEHCFCLDGRDEFDLLHLLCRGQHVATCQLRDQGLPRHSHCLYRFFLSPYVRLLLDVLYLPIY